MWASYAPTIGAFARMNLSNAGGFTGETTTYMAGAQLSWNIFDGLVREANLRESALRIIENRHAAEGLQLKVREEISRAMLDLESTRANLTKAREQVKLARESATIVNAAYEAGAATYLEIVDANAALTQAELNAISEELNAQLAVLKVSRAAGLFDPTGNAQQQ